MKIFSLKDFQKGWIIGGFTPTLFDTQHFEIAVKRYKAGDYEKSHHHKIATEYTVIVSGTVEMNGHQYTEDNIIVMEPGESTDFKCLTDVITTVIKIPGALFDKYED